MNAARTSVVHPTRRVDSQLHNAFKSNDMYSRNNLFYLPNAFWKRTIASSTLARLPKAETRTKPSPAQLGWVRCQGLVKGEWSADRTMSMYNSPSG
jgi:hypothetical protein